MTVTTARPWFAVQAVPAGNRPGCPGTYPVLFADGCLRARSGRCRKPIPVRDPAGPVLHGISGPQKRAPPGIAPSAVRLA
jgi:hypothetical protein